MTRVVLIDGPLPPGTPGLAASEMLRPGGDAHAGEHAAAMAAAIRAGCPAARLLGLAVFGEGLSTDAATVTRALGRAAELRPSVVLCAFGMARRDPAMAAGCAALRDAGALVVAASPARGGPVWPAAFADVVSVQGDARCGPGDWSHLGLPSALLGACPAVPGHDRVRGASAAAAMLAGLLAGRIAAGQAPDEALAALCRDARWQGRERRGLPAG